MSALKNQKGDILEDGSTATTTNDGQTIRSADPSARPDASLAQKLKGDFKGAINQTVGSIQAATGAAIRNKEMEQKGLSKMQEEDQRLGAKHGIRPVGTGLREKATGNSTTEPSAQPQAK